MQYCGVPFSQITNVAPDKKNENENSYTLVGRKFMLKEQIRNKKILKSMAFANMWNVDQILKQNFDKKFFVELSQEDQYRLLTLKMWEKKYYVSIAFILSVLLPFWKKRLETKKSHFSSKSLGVGIPTLIGKISEDVLKKAIEKKYPHGENVIAWKVTQQEAYLKLQNLVMTKFKDIEDFIQEYQESCLKARKRNNRIIESGKYTRRHFVGNPWF